MYTALRSRWAAIGAAVAVTLGAGGLVGVDAADDVSALVPITPVRILDTRSGDRVGSLDAAGNSTPHRLKVTGSPGIPASGVTGVSLNVTAVDTQANEFGGFVTVYPCASTTAARPDVSNLNFVSGQTLANSVTIPVSADGHVCVYVYGTAHILADANGYYTKSAPDPVDAYTRGETDTLIDTKADQTDLDTLETTVGGKANQTDLDTLETTVNRKADQTDLDTLETTVNRKANQTDLDTLETTVNGKANQTDLDTKLDADIFTTFPSAPVTLDDEGIVGGYTSIAIGVDGNPVISYYDVTNYDLKVAACNNPACTTSTNNTVDNTGAVGAYTSIAIGVDGNPVISYYDLSNTALKIAVCTDPTCATSVKKILDNTGDVGLHTSIAIGVDGKPVISHYDAGGRNLKVAACVDLTCTSSDNNTLDEPGDVGSQTSIAIGISGNPVIAYRDTTSGKPKVAACRDVTCTSNDNSFIDATSGLGSYPSIAIGVGGNPIVSYYDYTNSALRIATCDDPACGSSTNRMIDDPGTATVGSHTSIAIGVNGNPIISYYDVTNGDLKLATCDNPTCTTSANNTVDAGGDVGSHTSIAIGIDGNPIVAYSDNTTQDLRVKNMWWVTGGR